MKYDGGCGERDSKFKSSPNGKHHGGVEDGFLNLKSKIWQAILWLSELAGKLSIATRIDPSPDD